MSRNYYRINPKVDVTDISFVFFGNISAPDTSLYTRTTLSEYTLTSSGSVVIVTSLVTAVITGSDPGQSGGARSLNGSADGGNSFFSNTGATAGVFVVVGLVAAGIAIGLGFFFVRRKRARKLDEDTRIAAGGAGDGGAGRNRFDDDEDDASFVGDSRDPFSNGNQEMSEGHGYMSSYGSMLPLVAAGASGAAVGGGAGAYGRPNSGYDTSTSGGRANMGSYEAGYSPAQSSGSIPYQLPAFGTAYPAVGAYGPPAGGGGANYGTTRSHEGVLHDNWAEYVDGGMIAGAGGARSHEGHSPGDGSQEGPCKLELSYFHSIHSKLTLLRFSVGSSNSHSQQGHSPNFRDSVESYYAPDPQPQHQQQQSLPSDYAAFRNSLYGGMANENHGPAVPPKGATDQRLNPDLLGGQGDDRGGEAASLADDADYSRVLRYVLGLRSIAV